MRSQLGHYTYSLGHPVVNVVITTFMFKPTGIHMMKSSNWNIFRVTGPLWGELPVTDEVPSQKPVTRHFDVFFDLRLNKRLSKHSRRRWFEIHHAHDDVIVTNVLDSIFSSPNCQVARVKLDRWARVGRAWLPRVLVSIASLWRCLDSRSTNLLCNRDITIPFIYKSDVTSLGSTRETQPLCKDSMECTHRLIRMSCRTTITRPQSYIAPLTYSNKFRLEHG